MFCQWQSDPWFIAPGADTFDGLFTTFPHLVTRSVSPSSVLLFFSSLSFLNCSLSLWECCHCSYSSIWIHPSRLRSAGIHSWISSLYFSSIFYFSLLVSVVLVCCSFRSLLILIYWIVDFVFWYLCSSGTIFIMLRLKYRWTSKNQLLHRPCCYFVKVNRSPNDWVVFFRKKKKRDKSALSENWSRRQFRLVQTARLQVCT